MKLHALIEELYSSNSAHEKPIHLNCITVGSIDNLPIKYLVKAAPAYKNLNQGTAIFHN